MMYQKLNMANELPIVHAADESSITTAHFCLKNCCMNHLYSNAINLRKQGRF